MYPALVGADDAVDEEEGRDGGDNGPEPSTRKERMGGGSLGGEHVGAWKRKWDVGHGIRFGG